MNPSRLIVALDVPDRARIVALATVLKGEVAMVKIGLEAYVAHGPDLVRELVDDGIKVFLDLKLHDIPRTVAAAARETSRLGATLLTVHASGGAEMVRAAREACRESTSLVAVTVLTSLTTTDIAALGVRESLQDVAHRWAKVALDAGANGIVCSAHELARLAALPGVRVVPGVRPSGATAGDDQKRVATPREAAAAGATWLVVGRPVLEAPDPIVAARAINASIV